MPAAIKIEGCADIEISNCEFGGFDVGVDASNSRDLRVNGNTFRDIGTAVRADGIDGLHAANNLHERSQARPSVLFRHQMTAAVWRRYELSEYQYRVLYGG